jgi:glutamate-ammonia-ligase adenylyltransferase
LPDPAAAASRIEAWRSGKPRALRTAAAREAFEAVLPALVDAFGAAPDAMRALNRFDDLVMRLPSGVNFFRLLQARPELVEILATLLCHAPALADQLGRRPELIEGLIDSSAFAPPPPVEQLIADFSRAERVAEDYQLVLDRGAGA